MNERSNNSRNSDSSLPAIPGLSGSIPNVPSIPGWTSERDASWGSNVSESDLARGAEDALKFSEKQEIIKWSLVVVGALTLLRALASAFFTIVFVVGPILYLYLHQTCPTEESFDTRKELKRLLRGHHLSDDHPDKPKGYFASMVARASATVAAESAVLTGYKLEMIPFKGAFFLAKLDLPSMEMQVYWLGIAGEWRHIHTSQQRSVSKKTD